MTANKQNAFDWLEDQSEEVKKVIFDYAKPKLEKQLKRKGHDTIKGAIDNAYKEYVLTLGIERIQNIFIEEVHRIEEEEKEQAYEYANLENYCETGDVLEEIANQNKAIPHNFFCRYEWLNDCIKRIEDPTHISELLNRDKLPNDYGYKDLDTAIKTIDLDSFEQLNKQWQELKNERHIPPPYEVPNYYSNPIETFLSYVNYGQYPPPELLIMLSKAFELYYLAKGDISLEQAFFGNPKQRKGTGAEQADKDNLFKEFHRIVIQERAIANLSGKKFSIERLIKDIMARNREEQKAAKKKEGEKPKDYWFFPTQYHENNIDSLLKAYQRWRKKNTYNDEDK